MSNSIVFLNSGLLFKFFWKFFNKAVDCLFVDSSFLSVVFIHWIHRYLPNFVKDSGRVLENIIITVFASSNNTSMVWSNKASTSLVNFPFKTARSKISFLGKGNSRNIKTSITFVILRCLLFYIKKPVTKNNKVRVTYIILQKKCEHKITNETLVLQHSLAKTEYTVGISICLISNNGFL